nr:replication protein [Cronobacter dublinensis]
MYLFQVIKAGAVTRIANELLEAVIAADLTARQLKVVLAVMRKTYGFGRVLDRISNVQIAEETGIHHTHICKAKNELIAMNVLVSSGNQLGINKVVSDWKTGISQNSKTLAKTATQRAAIYSFAYNVGPSAAIKSTLMKKLNDGDYVGACNELKRWIYAGGKKWRGLMSRREVEHQVCMWDR